MSQYKEYIIPIATAVAAVLFTKYMYKRLTQGSSTTEKTKQHSCPLPECVRCSKSQVILQTAMERYEYAQWNCYPDELKRVIKSFKNYQDEQTNEENINSFSITPSFEAENMDADGITLCNDSALLQDKRNPVVYSLPDLPSQPWWDVNKIVNTQKLRLDYLKIFREFEFIYMNYVTDTTSSSCWTMNQSPQGRWNICSLVNQGVPVYQLLDMCPATRDLLASLQCYMKDCVFGNVIYSVLYPGTSIEEHCGPTNVRLRAHLCLKIPKTKNCTITVGGETRQWKEGEMMVFDDSYPHSVDFMNNDEYGYTRYIDPLDNSMRSLSLEGVRGVLIIDVWHCNLNEMERQMLGLLFGSDHYF